MRKVMLVIDEVHQLRGLEGFLRRLGFDVLSLGRDSLVPDALLGFPAEIVIASDKGKNVDGLKLAQKLRKQVPPPRVALSYSGPPPQYSKDELKAIDAFMEIPAAGESAVLLLAQLAGVPATPLLEKFRKFAGAKLTEEEQKVVVQGGGAAAPSAQAVTSSAAATPTKEWDPKRDQGKAATTTTERTNRYAQFLENHSKDLEGAPDVMPRERAKELMKKLKEDALPEKAKLDAINAEKIKFVEKLFEEGNGVPPKEKK